MIFRVFAGVVVVALLVAGWLIANNEQNGPAATVASPKAPDPGYSAQDAVLVETGPDGLPIYSLHASTIQQQPASSVTVLDNVSLQFRDPAGRVWNVRANQGFVSNGTSEVQLSGAVNLSGLMPSDQQPISITTDALAVDTHTEIVTTADPVAIEWNGQTLSGRGLVAHLKEQRVKLEADVHGLYRP
ncbi:MAG: LPS export ABC transporter periplasmic protein LptC [Steroidobacteraceae bacterium]